MHILMDDPLQELRQLQRWHEMGLIGVEEFTAMYRDLDRSNAAALCENRDGRIAVQIRDGRKLCGVCILILEGKENV